MTKLDLNDSKHEDGTVGKDATVPSLRFEHFLTANLESQRSINSISAAFPVSRSFA